MSELSQRLLLVSTLIENSPLLVTISKINSDGVNELEFEVGHIKWKLNYSKLSHNPDDQFLRSFRLAVMGSIDKRFSLTEEGMVANNNRLIAIIASAIRELESEYWIPMERKIRSTFKEWLAGPSIKEAVAEYKYDSAKAKVELILRSLSGFSREEIISLVARVYDEQVVRKIIES
ncbi:MAG: hypothetical protein WC708_00265 [Lentisphaeria bacterium]